MRSRRPRKKYQYTLYLTEVEGFKFKCLKSGIVNWTCTVKIDDAGIEWHLKRGNRVIHVLYTGDANEKGIDNNKKTKLVLPPFNHDSYVSNN